jgi:hypothetical protein
VKRLVIDVEAGDYAVAKLDPEGDVPAGLLAPGAGALVSITRTRTEVSVVCPAGRAPRGAEVEAGWRLLTVRGPVASTLTGIIAALANELAAAGVALLSLSTFDTDHVLVKAVDLARAVATLRAAGHEVHLPT